MSEVYRREVGRIIVKTQWHGEVQLIGTGGMRGANEPILLSTKQARDLIVVLDEAATAGEIMATHVESGKKEINRVVNKYE